MNWDKGLKRVTLVLSIIGGIIGAGLFLYDSIRVLRHNENVLASKHQTELTESATSDLIYRWKRAKTFSEQDILWITWTGHMISNTPRWVPFDHPVEPKHPNVPVVMGRMLPEPSAEELVLLKEQGWITVKGEPLPLTPAGVWYVKRCLEIKDLEKTVKQNRIDVPVAMVVGGLLASGAIWMVYAAVRWVGWPLWNWMIGGFREEKQEGV